MVKSNQHSGLWPYLGVLGLLFALSVAAPRGWRQPANYPHQLAAVSTGKDSPVSNSPLRGKATILHATSDRVQPGKPNHASRSPALEPAPELAELHSGLLPQASVLQKKVTRQYQPAGSNADQRSAAADEGRHGFSSVMVPTAPEPTPIADDAARGWTRHLDQVGGSIRIAWRPELLRSMTELRALRAGMRNDAAVRQSPVSGSQSKSGQANVALSGSQGFSPTLAAESNATKGAKSSVPPATLVTDVGTVPALASARASVTISDLATGGVQADLPATGALLESAPQPHETITDLWPTAWALQSTCEALRGGEQTRQWANQVLACLAGLEAKQLHDPGARELLQELRWLSLQAGGMIGRMRDANEISAVRRAQYDLVRRLEIWDVMAARAQSDGPGAACIRPNPQIDEPVLLALQQVHALLKTDPAGQTWERYLHLSDVTALAQRQVRGGDSLAKVRGISHGPGTVAANANLSESELLLNERRTMAAALQQRLKSQQLSAAQQTFLRRGEFAELAHAVNSWTLETRPLTELAAQMEQYEATRLPGEARRLAVFLNQLELSSDPRDPELARKLSLHYRNANSRVVVSEAFLNRIIPEQIPATEAVRERIAGVPTQGLSTTFNDVKLKLIPADGAWRFAFEIAGMVDTHASSRTGPVTFLSRGSSNYTAEKLVLVNGEGIQTLPATANAFTRSRLARLDTDFDGVPLLRQMIRSYARQAHEEGLPAAEREVSQKVANKATHKVDTEVDARLATTENRLKNIVIAKLQAWELDPTIVTLQSTAERATARIRLAGEGQLAAHSARPQALSNSLASVQLHETVVNNALEQLGLAGKSFTIPELHAHVNHKLQRTGSKLPADLPEDVRFTFVEEDPLTIRCEEGRIVLTLAMAELKQGNRSWRDFEVEVAYRLQTHGLQLQLVRDGTIELGGAGHTGKLDVILRGIFAKIFSRERQLDVLPATVLADPRLRGMTWTQIMSENGWLGLSLGEQPRLSKKGR